MPWQLVLTRSNFERAAHGIRPPGGVWCHVSGCDIVRDADGRWKVLEDNVRTPSGISYVLENRIAMSRLLPELFSGYDVRPVSNYPALLLDALQAAAPGGGENPPWSYGRRAPPTAPTSSTPSSPARWASSSSRRPTSSCATASVTCARRGGSPR